MLRPPAPESANHGGWPPSAVGAGLGGDRRVGQPLPRIPIPQQQVERILAELELLPSGAAMGDLAGGAAGQVLVADGNAYFNRSGPRIADPAELLAACLHRQRFPGHLARYRRRSGGSTPT
jgi:hypothetical protein